MLGGTTCEKQQHLPFFIPFMVIVSVTRGGNATPEQIRLSSSIPVSTHWVSIGWHTLWSSGTAVSWLWSVHRFRVFSHACSIAGFSGHCGVCSSKSSFQPPLFSFHRTFYLKAQDVNQLETAALLEAGTCRDSKPCSSKLPRTLKTSTE